MSSTEDNTPADERRVNLAVGWHDNRVIVAADTDHDIPPVSLAVFITGGYVQTYLTMDEAALVGKALLDAATSVARARPADVRPGVPPDIANALETIADAAAAPGGSMEAQHSGDYYMRRARGF